MPDEKWYPGKATIGSYIRTQRELSRLSLRELARMSQVSNAYLSQVERGIHEPSLRVLAAVAEALSLPLEDSLRRRVQTPRPPSPAVTSTQSGCDPGRAAALPVTKGGTSRGVLQLSD